MYPQPTNNPWQHYPYWSELTSPPSNFSTNLYYTCPHCGCWIHWGNKYCSSCGKEIWVTPTQEETLTEIKRLLEELQKKVDSLSDTVKGEDKDG